MYLIGKPKGDLFGLARAFLKDSNSGSRQTYLDSDGAISDSLRRQGSCTTKNVLSAADSPPCSMQPLCSAPLGPAANLSDGEWHHLALATWPDGARGYRMFVDGLLVASMGGSQERGEFAR